MTKPKAEKEDKGGPSAAVQVESDQKQQKAKQKQLQPAAVKSYPVVMPQVESKERLGGIQLSPFWKNRPKLWFIQLEYQFVAYGVHSDDAKMGVVLRHLDEEAVFNIAAELEEPPQFFKYEYIKTVLIQRYSQSLEKQHIKLLQELEVGNKCPSNLMREMRTLAESNVTDDVLRKLWLQKLQKGVQDVLAVVQNSMGLDQLAQFADLVTKRTREVADGLTSSKDAEAIKKLTEEVNELKDIVKSIIKSSEIQSQKDADTIKELKEEVITLKGLMEQVLKRGANSSSNWESWKIWAS